MFHNCILSVFIMLFTNLSAYCDIKNLRSSWLTTTDVLHFTADFSYDSANQANLSAFAARKVRKRLSHKIRPPAHPEGLTERCCKFRK